MNFNYPYSTPQQYQQPPPSIPTQKQPQQLQPAQPRELTQMMGEEDGGSAGQKKPSGRHGDEIELSSGGGSLMSMERDSDSRLGRHHRSSHRRSRSRSPRRRHRRSRSRSYSRSRSHSRDRHYRRHRIRSYSRSRSRSPRQSSNRRERRMQMQDAIARSGGSEGGATKVVLNNLPHYADKEMLNHMITKQGFHPLDIRVVRRSTDGGGVRSFGFVDFRDSTQAQAWITVNNGKFKFDDGFTVRLEFSRDGDDRGERGGRGSNGRGSPPQPSSDWTCASCNINNFNRRSSCFKCGINRTDSDALEAKGVSLVGVTPSDTLLIRELPASANSDLVGKAFYGYTGYQPQRIQMATSKCYALVQMRSVEQAVNAIQMFNKKVPYIDNCAVIVTYSRQSLNQILLKENVDVLKSQGVSAGQMRDDPTNSAAQLAQNAIQFAQMSRNLGGSQQPTGQTTSMGAPSTLGGGDQPQSISTPFGYFPAHSTPDPKTFQHEPSSGYFFDASTGYYYDPKTDYYYQPKTGQWHFWCSRYSTYIPCEGGDVERKLRLQEEEKAERTISQAAVIQAAPALNVAGGGGGGVINESLFLNPLLTQDNFAASRHLAAVESSVTTNSTTADVLATCLDDQRQLISELRAKLPVGHPELAKMEAKLRRLEESVASTMRRGHPPALNAVRTAPLTWRDRPSTTNVASWRAPEDDYSQSMMSYQAPPAMPSGAPLPPNFSTAGMQQSMIAPLAAYDPLRAMDTFVAFQQLQQQVNQQLMSHLVPQQLIPAAAIPHMGALLPELGTVSSRRNVGRTKAVRSSAPVRRSPERRVDGRPSRFESMSEREKTMRLGGRSGSRSRQDASSSQSRQHSSQTSSSSRPQRSANSNQRSSASQREPRSEAPLDERLRADLRKREEEELVSFNICGNCGRRNHRREKCPGRAVGAEVVRRELERARQEKAREELLKEDLRKTADEYRCRRHDLIIQRLREAAPHGHITREHVRTICPKCARLGHSIETCTATEQVDIRVLKRVREEVAAFSRTFWVYLQDNCTIDFARKFNTFDLMDAIEASVDGVDPVSVQLRDKCASNGGYVTGGRELLLCSKCAQLGHSRPSCEYSTSSNRESDSAMERQHHDKMLDLVTAYRALCAEAKKEGKPGFKLGGRAAREEAEKKKKRRRGGRAGQPAEEPVADEGDDDDVIVLSDNDDEDADAPATSAKSRRAAAATSPAKAPTAAAVQSPQKGPNVSGGGDGDNGDEDDDEVVELIEVDEEHNDPFGHSKPAISGDQSAGEVKDEGNNPDEHGKEATAKVAKNGTNGAEGDLVILEEDD